MLHLMLHLTPHLTHTALRECPLSVPWLWPRIPVPLRPARFRIRRASAEDVFVPVINGACVSRAVVLGIAHDIWRRCASRAVGSSGTLRSSSDAGATPALPQLQCLMSSCDHRALRRLLVASSASVRLPDGYTPTHEPSACIMRGRPWSDVRL